MRHFGAAKGLNLSFVVSGVFKGCKSLANMQGYVIINGVLCDYFGEETNVVIPDFVTSIGNSAFGDCSSLTAVTIPDSVTSIGKGAFGSRFWKQLRKKLKNSIFHSGNGILQVVLLVFMRIFGNLTAGIIVV